MAIFVIFVLLLSENKYDDDDDDDDLAHSPSLHGDMHLLNLEPLGWIQKWAAFQ